MSQWRSVSAGRTTAVWSTPLSFLNARRGTLATEREHASAQPLVVITPTRGWVALKLRDLWDYRDLLYFLIWRDVKVRYKQTALGALWALLQPFIAMVVFTVLFHRALHVKSEYHVPYPLFSYTALLPWLYFASCLSGSSMSIVASGWRIAHATPSTVCL